MDTEKAIDAIEELKSKLKDIGLVSDFNTWLTVSKETLSYCVPNSSKPMPMRDVVNLQGNVLYNLAKHKATDILEGHINNLNRFGYKPKGKGEGGTSINLEVNQHNNQSQITNVKVNLDIILEALTDELTGGQVKELKGILDSEDEVEKRKKSFIDKLKGFGDNVASNVLANLIINPQIYGQLFDKL
ncbi:MAG: hypothetical protein HRT58_21940 [Crocinitomicaceae bacterium]|nr:hypothetical protein [Flavobacteriales bacterium]NQZ38337.1 hypothetical protein [Crocinitomicaceae bacterium]